MSLFEHFIEESKDKIKIYKLNENHRQVFIEKLPDNYKVCFISEHDLEERIVSFKSSHKEEMNEILPLKGSIKSGDFGEILCYLLFKEKYNDIGINGPKKWRWKENQDVAAPYSDVILYKNDIDKPSEEDILISIESKMKATKNLTSSPIQNAINGAQKDHISRMANSLSWLKKKAKDDSLKSNCSKIKQIEIISNLNRFIHSEKHGPYRKEVKAVAIIDNLFFNDEISKKTYVKEIENMNLEIFAINIDDLKVMYEDIYNRVLENDH